MGYYEDQQLADEKAAQPEAIRKRVRPSVTAGDVGKGILANVGNVLEDTTAINRFLGRHLGSETPAQRQSADEAATLNEQFYRAKSATIRDRMTPGGRVAEQASITPNAEGDARVWENPSAAVGLKAVEQLPWFLVSAIPGTAFAKATTLAAKVAGAGATSIARAGRVAAGVGAGAGNAYLNTGDVLTSLNQGVDELNDKQLQEQSPAYAHERKAGVPETEARANLKDIMAEQQVPLTAMVNFATGSVGAEAILAKALGGTNQGKKLIKGTIEGLILEGGGEGIEGAQQEGSRQAALKSQGIGPGMNWKEIFRQFIEQGSLGAVIGGGVGAVTNIHLPQSKPKTPDAAQGKALNPTVEPVVTGPQTPAEVMVAKTAPAQSPPIGPPVVAPRGGQLQKPPGASDQQTPRQYGKRNITAEQVAVTTPTVEQTPVIGPDQAQAAATAPAAGTPAAPQQLPPSAGALVRRRAQAAQRVTPSVTPAPLSEPVVPSVARPPEAVDIPPTDAGLPPVLPPSAPIPGPRESLPPPAATITPQVSPPPEVTPSVPPGVRAGTPQVLPDLAAQQARQAQQDAYNAQPDEVASRGTRYSQATLAAADDPKQQAAWRRKMELEAKKPNPSPTAVEVARMKGKPGVALLGIEKERLKELHRAWIQAREPAPAAPKATPAAAPVDEQATAHLVEITRDNPPFEKEIEHPQLLKERLDTIFHAVAQMPEEHQAALLATPYVKAAGIVWQKLKDGSISKPAIEHFHAVEQDFARPSMDELVKQGTTIEKKSLGSVGLSSGENIGAPEGAVATRGSRGAADVAIVPFSKENARSAVRKVELSAAEKAALVATSNEKAKAAAAAPKEPTTGPERVALMAKFLRKPTDAPRETKPAPAPKVTQRVTNKVKNREEAINESGRKLLELRQLARTEARSNPSSEVLTGLLHDVKRLQANIKESFGQAAHDRVNKQVEAILATAQDVSLASYPTMTGERFLDVLKGLVKKETPQISMGQARGSMDARVQAMATPIRTMTTRQVLASFDPDQVSASEKVQTTDALTFKIISERIMPRILALAGNVKFHILNDEDFKRGLWVLNGEAFYSNQDHFIAMKKSIWEGDPGHRALVALHEATHAAFNQGLRNNPKAMDDLHSLLSWVRDAFNAADVQPIGVEYAMTQPVELMAEAWANPRVQAYLNKVELPDFMARNLGLRDFKKYSVWQGVVAFVSKVLGLRRDVHTAMDGIMKISWEVAADRLTGDTQQYFTNKTNDQFSDLSLRVDRTPGPEGEVQGELVKFIEKLPRSRARRVLYDTLFVHQLTQVADKYFPKGMALAVSNAVEKMRVRRTQHIERAQQQVVTKAHQMQGKYAANGIWEKFVDIAHRSTMANIHPDVPLADAKNLHIKKGIKYDYARKEHSELSREWHQLPPELKDLWHKSAGFLTEQQNNIALLNLNNILESVLGRKDAQLARRIHHGTMTVADKNLFLTNAGMRALNNAVELKKIEGVYFPLMRRGDYVITGRYKLPEFAANRSTDPESEGDYVFNSADDARNFISDMRKRGLVVNRARSYTVDATTGEKYYTYTDPKTGVVEKDVTGAAKQFRFAKGDTNSKQVWEITVQDKLVEFHESEKSAHAAHREYKQDPNWEIHGVDRRDVVNFHTSGVSSRQLRRSVNAMQQSSAWKAMPQIQRDATLQGFMEMSLSFVSSTSPQNRARIRRNVAGFSREYTRNLAEYSAASAGTLARLEVQPEIDKAVAALHKHKEDYAAQDSETTLPRADVLRAIEENINYPSGTGPKTSNAIIQTMLTLSFLKRLASPAFHMINGLQPGMISGPVLAGRHGVTRSFLELGKAYNAMGFIDTLASGIKDTKKALTDYMEGTTDYMADIRTRLAKQKDGAELGTLLDYLHEHGWIDKDSGLEVSELINSGSNLGHLLHRTDHVVRQFGTAVEVVNRAVTAIAAYRLERARGASVQEATVYAQETVANTQGGYSASNAAKYFKHPLGRVLLQFKKFGQLQYFLLGKLAYNSFKGATPQERAQAAKSLAALLVAHVAVAGATGLPTEPIRATWMLLDLFLDMPSWDDAEQGAVGYAKQLMGSDLGDAVMHGLPRLAGIDLNSRVGLQSAFMFGEPQKQDQAHVKSWIFDQVSGAPIGMGVDAVTGAQQLLQGNWGAAAEKLAPLKIIADTVRAARRAGEGKVNTRGEQTMTPRGVFDTAVQMLGIKPADVARQEEDTSVYYNKAGQRKAARQGLLDAFKQAAPNERAGIRREIMKYNATVPKAAKINTSTLNEMLKRRKKDLKKGYLKAGIYAGKQNKDLLDAIGQ